MKPSHGNHSTVYLIAYFKDKDIGSELYIAIKRIIIKEES